MYCKMATCNFIEAGRMTMGPSAQALSMRCNSAYLSGGQKVRYFMIGSVVLAAGLLVHLIEGTIQKVLVHLIEGKRHFRLWQHVTVLHI